MNKFYGSIGFSETIENPIGSGIYTENIIVRNYYGDIVKNNRRLSNSSFTTTNDNINISNSFSIIADPLALQNFHKIRFLEFMGTKWKVTNVDVEYPRLILSVGGIYNE